MLRGVNLGNWLVLEKWMSPGLFAGTDAEDETALCHQLPADTRRERYAMHRDEFVTDRDFAALAARGASLVRLPVPYFVFGGHEPFEPCIDYVDRALAWAHKHGIAVLLDLHTVPGSQNGFDNGGICGVCTFHRDPANARVALDVLERLAERYRDAPALWGIEVLNEPVSPAMWDLVDVPRRYPATNHELAAISEAVPSDFLQDFYREAYARIRRVAPDVRIVLHDGFRIDELADFFADPSLRDIVVDTHMYLMTYTLAAGFRELDEYVAYVEDVFAPTLARATARFPVMVGEWCIDTSSAKVADLDARARRDYYRRMADVQLRTFSQATAWTYWSAKMLIDTPASDIWDAGKAMDLGLLPADAFTRTD